MLKAVRGRRSSGSKIIRLPGPSLHSFTQPPDILSLNSHGCQCKATFVGRWNPEWKAQGRLWPYLSDQHFGISRLFPPRDPRPPAGELSPSLIQNLVIHVRHARRYHCPWSCQCYHSLSKVVLVHHTTSRACQHWRFPTHGTPVGSRTGTCCPWTPPHRTVERFPNNYGGWV